MKYRDTIADAQKYNRTKDTKEKTVDCSGCGETIPMNGENCVDFGVYACTACRRNSPEKFSDLGSPKNG